MVALHDRQWVTLRELQQLRGLSKWHVTDLSRKRQLVFRCVAGRRLKPYQVDLAEYDKLESATCVEITSSLIIEKKSARHITKPKREVLWPR